MSDTIAVQKDKTGAVISVRSTAPVAVAIKEKPDQKVVAAGLRGQRGEAGLAGTMTAVTNVFVSTGPISAHKVIYAGVSGPEVADKDVLTVQDKILGVTISSASGVGEDVLFVSNGLIADPSFTFTPGPIWLGSSGQLTQVKPTSGLCIQLAIASSATTIVVDVLFSIKLA